MGHNAPDQQCPNGRRTPAPVAKLVLDDPAVWKDRYGAVPSLPEILGYDQALGALPVHQAHEMDKSPVPVGVSRVQPDSRRHGRRDDAPIDDDADLAAFALVVDLEGLARIKGGVPDDAERETVTVR